MGAEQKSTVAIARCATYEPGDVSRAVGEVLEHLGGMSRFVSPGEKVLLKPNLLSAKGPDRAITTHPAVIEAVIKLIDVDDTISYHRMLVRIYNKLDRPEEAQAELEQIRMLLEIGE